MNGIHRRLVIILTVIVLLMYVVYFIIITVAIYKNSTDRFEFELYCNELNGKFVFADKFFNDVCLLNEKEYITYREYNDERGREK